MEEKKQNDKPLNKDFNEPKLRFKKYPNSWTYENLCCLVSIHARIGWQGLKQNEQLDIGDIYLITGTDFDNGSINFKTSKYVSEFRYKQDKNIQLQNDDILITKDGTLGKVAIIRNLNKRATLNSGIYRIRINDITKVDPNYLYQYLSAPFLLNFANKTSIGGTIKHLNQSQIVNLPIPLSTLEEQKKISKFLFNLELKIKIVNGKINILKKYRKGIIHHLIKKGSLTSKIRDLVRIEKKTGLASSYGKDIGSYPFFINNDEGIEKYCDEYAFDGQYLIINTGGTASVKYYDGKFSAMSDCLILRPIAHAIGLYYFLVANEKQINTAGFQGTGLKHLDQKWFFNLKVILPNLSDAELNKLNELTEFQIENLKKKAQLIKSFKQYLLTNMFI